MRCYTFLGGRIYSGMAVLQSNQFGPGIYLGKAVLDRGVVKRVALYQGDPPEVKDERVHNAELVKIIMNKEVSYAFAKPHSCDDKVLVRIHTAWHYQPYYNTAGSWCTVAGSPRNIIVGQGVRGEYGRLGTWDDGIVMMSPGDALRVQPEGDEKVPAYALVYGREGLRLKCMLFRTYEGLLE